MLFAAVMTTSLCASAASNDIFLRGLVETNSNGDVIPRNGDFAKLTNQLGYVFTPSPVQPAETTGQAGFDFALDYTVHQISSKEAFWTDAVEGKLEGRTLLPFLQSLGVRGRKGFILPVPLTSEVELGATWLIDSSLLVLGGNMRVALNEGFRFIPDVAIMTGINRLVGSPDLDFTTVTVGGSVSKGFGLFGDFNLTPFVSYQSIFINAASRILDLDPLNTGDVGNNVTFDSIQAVTLENGSVTGMNRLDRISGGLRLHVAVVQISVGVDVNLVPEDGALKPYFQSIVRAGMLF